MKQIIQTLPLKTKKKVAITDITHNITAIIKKNTIVNGLVTLWVPHTTAGITVNEHDPDLWTDMLSTMLTLVPIKANYRHNAKYGSLSSEQNAHAHILTSMIKPSMSVPLKNGEMVLGTWQSILFVELDGPRHRSIYVQILGE